MFTLLMFILKILDYIERIAKPKVVLTLCRRNSLPRIFSKEWGWGKEGEGGREREYIILFCMANNSQKL